MRRPGLALLLLLLAAAAPAPRLVVLATAPSGSTTTMHLVAPGGTLGPALARFDHAPGASVQAALLPDRETVVAVADHAPGADRSFASSLVRLEAGAEARLLADRIVVASRPHPLPGGKVLVSRGRPGQDRADGSYRVDELSVDEIDLQGRARTLLAGTGYLLFIAAVHGGEVVIYRVGPAGADLVTVPLAGGAPRVLVPSLPPFARDFTVEAGALVFLDRHERDARRWLLWRVELASGAATIAGESARATRGLSARSRIALPDAPGLRLTVAGALP